MFFGAETDHNFKFKHWRDWAKKREYTTETREEKTLFTHIFGFYYVFFWYFFSTFGKTGICTLIGNLFTFAHANFTMRSKQSKRRTLEFSSPLLSYSSSVFYIFFLGFFTSKNLLKRMTRLPWQYFVAASMITKFTTVQLFPRSISTRITRKSIDF